MKDSQQKLTESPNSQLSRVATAAFVVSLLIFHPGFLSPDSLAQFYEAKHFLFGDGHPPLMALLWSLLHRISYGQFGMLLAQLILYWSAIFTFVSQLRYPERRKIYLLLGIGFFPPALGLIGMIWKDILLVGFLMLSSAYLLAYSRKPKALWRFWLGIAVAFLGTSLRLNGFFALWPLLFAFFWIQEPRFSKAFLKSALSFVTLLFLNGLITSALSQESSHPWKILAVYDVVGVQARIGEAPLGEQLPFATRPVDLPTIRLLYTSRSLIPLVTEFCVGEKTCLPALFVFNNNTEELTALKKLWIRTILEHPFSYLAHRWRVFRHVTGQTRDRLWGAVNFDISENKEGFTLQRSALQEKLAMGLEWLSETWLYKAWIYFLGAILLGALAWRKAEGVTVGITASAVLYEIGYFFVAPAADFRYSFWLIMATLFAWVLYKEPRAARRR